MKQSLGIWFQWSEMTGYFGEDTSSHFFDFKSTRIWNYLIFGLVVHYGVYNGTLKSGVRHKSSGGLIHIEVRDVHAYMYFILFVCCSLKGLLFS